VSLPIEIDADGIKAECHDGILALYLPRANTTSRALLPSLNVEAFMSDSRSLEVQQKKELVTRARRRARPVTTCPPPYRGDGGRAVSHDEMPGVDAGRRHQN